MTRNQRVLKGCTSLGTYWRDPKQRVQWWSGRSSHCGTLHGQSYNYDCGVLRECFAHSTSQRPFFFKAYSNFQGTAWTSFSFWHSEPATPFFPFCYCKIVSRHLIGALTCARARSGWFTGVRIEKRMNWSMRWVEDQLGMNWGWIWDELSMSWGWMRVMTERARSKLYIKISKSRA